MKCNHCSTALPSDALFCGECGRTVTKKTSNTGRAGLSSLSTPLPLSEPWMAAPAAAECTQCGFLIAPDDIFCGECGFVVASASRASERATDTNVIERIEAVEPDSPASLPDEVESTRIVPHLVGSERFVLQFSTGESFTVFGSGLVGRSPKPEPGEYFDQLIRIIDSSRSVSKTHLEFGQESGSFWVKDRYSGNGTIVREPESDPLRCRPERRYRLVRGSRVDVGEQFFVVS